MESQSFIGGRSGSALWDDGDAGRLEDVEKRLEQPPPRSPLACPYCAATDRPP